MVRRASWSHIRRLSKAFEGLAVARTRRPRSVRNGPGRRARPTFEGGGPYTKPSLAQRRRERRRRNRAARAARKCNRGI